MKAIVIDYTTSTISLSSAFAKKAMIPGTQEYRQLQEVRRDYPDFKQTVRKFKTNTVQEHYRGLTYEYMRTYIILNDSCAEAALQEFDRMIDISKCHSKRYPVIKSWFLNRYPEIVTYGTNIESMKEYLRSVSEDDAA